MTQISIAATTDVHGFLDEGLTAITVSLENISADLLLDNGDFFVGSPFAAYAYDQQKISPLVTIANDLAYDVMVPGNHDLDFGLAWLQRQVSELKADYVCANLKDAQGINIFPAYTIKEIKGLKIAVIGLMTGAFNQLSAREVVEEVIVVNPFDALRDTLAHLKSETNCDLTVVCYHGGLTNDPVTGATWFYPSLEDQAYQLMTAFPEIDSLICGHQHFTNAGIHPQQIACLQVGTRAHVLGYQSFDIADGQVRIIDNRLLPLQEQATTYPLGAEGNAYQAWLGQTIERSAIKTYLKNRYPADYYVLPFSANTLEELLSDLVIPFPLSYYYLPGKAFSQLLDADDKQAIASEEFYTVLAITGQLPQTRLREGLLIPLFDDIIKHKAY